MLQFRLTILGVAAAALFGWRGSDQPPDVGPAPRLEGAWEITSVQRDGEADPLQIGAKMTFTGNEVKFEPKVAKVTVKSEPMPAQVIPMVG